MKVLLSDLVVEFLKSLPPEPRRRLRSAIRELEHGRGDIRALEKPLDGYCRLRVGGYRVILAFRPGDTVECVFAERRSVVYEILEDRLRHRIHEP